MIQSAEEFIALRNSDNQKEYNRARIESASIDVWIDIITKHPDMKIWVIRNKTIPIEILELLVTDVDNAVRKEIATKRKLNEYLINILKNDKDESVQFALICNAKITIEQLQLIDAKSNNWLLEKINERIKEFNK